MLNIDTRLAISGVIVINLASSCYSGRDLSAGDPSDSGADTGNEPGDPGVDDGDSGDPANGSDEIKLRLLTQPEYQHSLKVLFGKTFEVELAEDASVGGFYSIGAAQITVGEFAAEKYEIAARYISSQLFADPAGLVEIVGCEPEPTLNGSCTRDYIARIGRRAFRRPLTDDELTRWSQIAHEAAVLTEEPSVGLSTVTSGLLQSPLFLYRVETIESDPESARQKYDSFAMATRIAFLATGSPPDNALLDVAAQGQLDTADGVRAATRTLLESTDPSDHLSDFFVELTHIDTLANVDKDTDLFPEFDDALVDAMRQETQMWLREEVVSEDADVRALFDSDITFINRRLAEMYGLDDPGAGFVRVQLPPESGRAGILGKAGFLSRHSSPDSSAPTRRGIVVLNSLLCESMPPPPPGVETQIEEAGDELATTRELFERHVSDPSCAGCHTRIDPLGFAMEHFDAMGQFRAEEVGQPINAVGTLDGETFDGIVELGAWMRNNHSATRCLVDNLYRYANASLTAGEHREFVNSIAEDFADSGHIWRDLIVDFAASDAFRFTPPAAD